MFKLKIRNIILPTVIFLLLLITPTYAAKMETGEYTLDKESIVEDDLYVTGNNVTVSGIVDGDLIVIGENILVDGTITGDLYFIGSNIKLSGTVSGNTFAIGSNIGISATLRDNLYVLGMITNISGSINGDVMIGSGQLTLDGTVLDDVRAISGQFSSTASIGGDLLIESNNYTIDENDIAGELIAGSRSNKTQNDIKVTKDDFFGLNIGLALINFAGMYIVGLIIIFAAPVKTLQIEKKITTSGIDFVKSFAVGMVILFAVPIPLFLLILTLVGAPIAILIIGVLLFLSLFGTLWVESAIGHKILQQFKKDDSGRFLSLLLGRGISTVIKLIPFVNGLYTLSLMALAVGSVTRVKYHAYPKTKEIAIKKVSKKK